MKNMKFCGENGSKGTRVPARIMRESGFGQGEAVEFRPLGDSVVVLKRYMTAKELACAAYQLQELSMELLDCLVEACGACADCGESCPVEGLDSGDDVTELLEQARRVAGFPKDAKLHASVDKEEGTVLISEAGYTNDLRDLPEELVKELAAAGVSMCGLESILMGGEIVYGS